MHISRRWRLGPGARSRCSTSTTGRCSGRPRPPRPSRCRRPCSRSRWPSATARSARSPSGRPSRERRRRAAGPPASSWPSSSRARAACWPRPARAGRVPPDPGRRVNGLGAGDSFGGALLSRPAARLAAGEDPALRQRRRAPSSRPASSAQPQCRPPPRSRPIARRTRPPLEAVNVEIACPVHLHDYDRDHRARAARSGAVAAARGGPRHRGPTVGGDGRLMIVACDHPARGALARRRPADGDGQPHRPAGPARAPPWPTRAWTACWPPPTSSRTCCCSGRWRTSWCSRR